eukprot:gene18846-23084_t
MAKRAVRDQDVTVAIDTLLVPALSLAARDQDAGLLAPKDEERIVKSLEHIFAEMLAEAAKRDEKDKEKGKEKEAENDQAPPLPTEPKGESGVTVMIWPVMPLAKCAVPWFKWLMRESDCQVVALSPETLSSEAAQLAHQSQPAAFCLISLIDTSLRRERQLAKRITTMVPDLPIIAARLGAA